MSRRWRRLSRIDELRRLRAGARDRGSARETAARRCARTAPARPAPTAAASSARSAPAAGPRRAPRSRRAAACGRGVFMSSMRLMPPTNATRPSTWHELAVQPAQPVRAELPRRDLGPVLQQVARRRRRSRCSSARRQVVLARPSRRPARAPRRRAAPRAPARRRPRGPARRRRRCRSRARLRARAASMAAISAGKNSAPLRSSSIALPGVKRFIAARRAS